MLSDFLSRNRKRVLALSQRKVTAIAGLASDPEAWNQGLPEVYDHLIPALQHVAKYGTQSPGESDEAAAILRGEKMLRLGLTVSQVVHGYGAICQAITETAEEQGFAISTKEFNVVNRVLDIAIAEAVTAYERLHSGIAAKAEVQRLGSLAHELRNAMTNVTLAHIMIRDGMVGARGETNAVLEKGLHRMTEIIDRTLAETRLNSNPQATPTRLRLLDLVDEVGVTAIHAGQSRGIKFLVEVAPTIALEVDPQHMVSALSNLVQNAIKFSKPGTTVQLRAQESGDKVTIEIEDECGGLPPGRIGELFKPFTQGGADRSGMGLGLTISRRAIELNGGSLSARDLPGKGCVFTIILPKTVAHKRPCWIAEGSASSLPLAQPTAL
jgi:signal transduction histidine kinase